MTAFVPTPTAIKWAAAECRRTDGGQIKSMESFASARWMGFLGEWYFAIWLRGNGVEFARNGGNDPLPDFVIAQVGVGVKTAGAREDFTRGHHVEIYEPQRRSSPDQLFFVGHVGLDTPAKIVMLGGLDAGSYFRRARWVPTGGALNSTTTSRADTWRLRISELLPPDAWLAGLQS